jgi:hypothetical protein
LKSSPSSNAPQAASSNASNAPQAASSNAPQASKMTACGALFKALMKTLKSGLKGCLGKEGGCNAIRGVMSSVE